MTHIPLGTGNDFIRNFTGQDSFARMDILRGYDLLPVDIIKAGERMCLNVCALGVDARAALEMQKFRFAKKLSPKVPYNLGVGMAMLKGLSRHCHVTVDGEIFDDSYTLVTVMNGRYYGGGFNPAPGAVLDDGKLDVVLIKKVNVFQVAGLIGHYAKGEMEKLGDHAILRRAEKVRIATLKPTAVTYDGEIGFMTELDIEVLPQRLAFAVPKGVGFLKPKEN